MEDKDNYLDEAENVTDEEGVEDTVDRVELFLLTRGAASTRRSSAMQRSVVLVVTFVVESDHRWRWNRSNKRMLIKVICTI